MKTNVKQPSRLQNWASRYFLLVVLLLSVGFFSLLEPNFFSFTNLLDILRTASIIGIMAMGGCFVMSSGEINFCIGAQVTFAGAIIGVAMSVLPPSLYLVGVLITIAVLVFSGFVIGTVVTRLEVPGFLATLTFQMILLGVVRWLTGNKTYYSPNWGDNYTFLGQTNLGGVFPMPILVFVVIAIFTHIFMEYTRMGRYIFAVGANAITSRQVGINVEGTKILAYMFSGAFAAFAGILLTSMFKDVSMNMGSDYQMSAIAATVLSAAFWKTGKYNVPGAVTAAVLIMAIQNGVITIGGSYYYKEIIQGILLLIAVLIIASLREDGLPKVSFTK